MNIAESSELFSENSKEFPNRVPSDVLVSVCMITYNHAAYIRQAIESVLMQQCDFALELCIGEDASTDETRDICVSYAKLYPGIIRLFLWDGDNKINFKGRPTGRRNTIELRKAARGRYISLIDGDDFWIHPKKLQLQFNLLEENPKYSICCTRAIRRDLESRNDFLYPKVGVNFIPHNLSYGMMTGVASATIFYRAIDEDLEYTLSEDMILRDWSLMASLTRKSGVCPILDIVSAVYRCHAGAFWSNLNIFESFKLGIALQAAKVYIARYPDEMERLSDTIFIYECNAKISSYGICSYKRFKSIFGILGYKNSLRLYVLITQKALWSKCRMLFSRIVSKFT